MEEKHTFWLLELMLNRTIYTYTKDILECICHANVYIDVYLNLLQFDYYFSPRQSPFLL